MARSALRLAALACLAGCAPPRVPQIGQPLPEVALPDLEGRIVRLSDFRGKVVIVNFWASWCPPCLAEMPSLEKLYRALNAKGLEVVAISVDEDPSVIRAYRRDLGVTFPVLHDKGARVSHAFQTFKYPETYVVDRDGKLVMKMIGAVDWVEPLAIHRFVELLGGAAGV